MGKKQIIYTVDELLQDAAFVSSVLHPTPENQEFWKELIQVGSLSIEDYEKACLYVKAAQSKQEKLSRVEKEQLWKKIEIGNKKNLKGKIRKLYVISLSAVACMLLLFAVSGYLYFENRQKAQYDPIAQLKNSFDIREESESEIRLVLSDKEQIAFEKKNIEVKYSDKGEVKVNSQTVVEGKKEDPVAEKKGNIRKEETAANYNQLIVPKGKHSTLLLSDGSKLWINANSHVIFPVTFEKNKREIYVDGEIYLEVARNETSPFIVKTSRMQVDVMGTSFNVRSYQDEEADDVVLVTGSVHVKVGGGQETELFPNQHFSSTVEGAVNIQTVDVYDYICWKDGLLRYKSESLSKILARLSNYYGKTIRWEPMVAEVSCSGKLDLKEDLEKVLEGLTTMIPVKFTTQEGYYYFTTNN